MASENPHHVAIWKLGERQHAARNTAFDGARIRFGHGAQPERDATNRDRLEWARRDYVYGTPDDVIGHTTRVLSSGDATRSQAAEALRLRAVSYGITRRYAEAVADATAGLELAPGAEGPVGGDDLRELLALWRRIVG